MLETNMRTHTCGQLRMDHEGKDVTLCGWVQSRRDHGGIIFVDLRDRHGLTQVVFDPNDTNKELFEQAGTLRREDCVQVTGTVRPRGEGLENPRLATGKIEIITKEGSVLTRSETPPFEIEDDSQVNDDLRLEYRYLDLRRPSMQEKLVRRSIAAQAARKYLIDEEDFLEIETPILVKSTPEGARDYVVPSRVNAGKFYALPQSPQIYKQLLMVSGCDRYFQLAKCFRDEDLRADRQPDFTQIDLEMSFVTQEDVFRVCEGIAKSMCDSLGVSVQIPFPRLTYDEAMAKYSSDKPDVRFDLFTHDVTELVQDVEFTVFRQVLAAGGIVKCINPEVELSRKDVDRYVKFAQDCGAKGMAWMRVADGKLESNIAKYFDEASQQKLISHLGAKDGSMLMFIADEKKTCNDVISRLRVKVAQDAGMVPDDQFAFTWVINFPLFEKSEESPTGWTPAHHMFSMPSKETIQFMDSDPEKVYSDLYDLVLNGVELGSGSIRCHDSAIQEQIMKKVGFPQEEAQEKFGFMMKAFTYGAPPHGGFAFGFDRFVALLCGTQDIREVIAFPKNKSAQCPMDHSPAPISDKQLKELHIELLKKKSE